MRADRLLTMMLLLRSHDRLTAAQLADRLEVSERTVLRDVEALSTAGVPVYAERGRHGGFAMLEGFRADTTGLDETEAQVLFAHLGLETFGDLGLSREARSVLDKLAASAPARLEHPTGRLREVVHVDRRRWFASPDDLTHLPVLRRACVDARRVRVRYESARADAAQTRTLDPLGLVENGNRWYLVAYHRGTPHTYRLSRMTTVTVLDAAVRLPGGARLEAVWDELRTGFESLPGPSVTATLRLRATDEAELRGAMQTMVVSGTAVRVVARTPSHVDVTADFRLRRSVLGFCLGSAGGVRILAPDELRDDARTAALASLAALDAHDGLSSRAGPR